MAGIISVTNEKDWSAANWAYWSLMDYLIEAFAKDPEVAHRLEVCKWSHWLGFPSLREEDPKMAEKIFGALKTVAKRCAAGELVSMVEGKPLDDTSQKQFRETMNDLVSILGDEVAASYGGG
jgi:hypothetical protein